MSIKDLDLFKSTIRYINQLQITDVLIIRMDKIIKTSPKLIKSNKAFDEIVNLQN